MFDPFNDFNDAGYLRNVRKDKNEEIIKHFEHNLFRANLSDALEHLSKRKILVYADFLDVHRILFSEYYPWAGQDRMMTMPNSAVSKAGIWFEHPARAERAVNEGLRLGQIKETMNNKPGEVMGLFAFGHPFMDGNGRTMLLVHHELSHRAGFSIAWNKTKKSDYLSALSNEINLPGRGILDTYLLQFKDKPLKREFWSENVLSMKGLDGLDATNIIEGDMTDSLVVERYRQLDKQRNYSYVKHEELN
jgi:cell filamentation protein